MTRILSTVESLSNFIYKPFVCVNGSELEIFQVSDHVSRFCRVAESFVCGDIHGLKEKKGFILDDVISMRDFFYILFFCVMVQVPPKPNTFLPFGNGVHACPGSELAKLEMFVLLHHLTTSYRSFLPFVSSHHYHILSLI